MKNKTSNMIFKHQVVSDLAFVLQAPLIYQDFDISQHWLPESQDKLAKLDQNPKPLEQVISACKSHFLGSYFETLFSFALNHFSSLQVVFEHTQLISPERTLGEIDALIKDENKQAHQFEVAIKFYLESNAELGHWIGPNKNDSFIKKYQRAKSHQLTILDLPEARPLLAQHSISLPIEKHLLMFGILFNQVTDQSVDSLLDADKYQNENDKFEDVSPLSKTGFWIRINNLSWLQSGYVSCQELIKPFWISEPVDQQLAANKGLDFHAWEADLEARFQQDERPRMFMLKWKKADASSQNLRLFVVPKHW